MAPSCAYLGDTHKQMEINRSRWTAAVHISVLCCQVNYLAKHPSMSGGCKRVQQPRGRGAAADRTWWATQIIFYLEVTGASDGKAPP